ncbi:ABC transporter ATP-binding protein [Bacillus thuringiensis]|nr:ABC transporter ATP-binding protein [Bacillus thuringiensis]
MEEGEVVSEIQLGKFRNDDLKAREEKLLKWLAVLGFQRQKLLLNIGVFSWFESSKRYIIIF